MDRDSFKGSGVR